jgi:glycosyltransferase involved in cell wall biosynthesis
MQSDTMGSTPRLSVLMTSYNREQYIAEAITSVLTSSFTDLELIIVDDGSKDRTVEIARSFAAKDARVRVYINEKNLGDYPNRNRAASYARGEYLMYVDSDDMILKEGFEACIRAMEAEPKADFAMRYFGELDRPTLLSSEEAIRKHFFDRPFLTIGPGGTIMRRTFYGRMNGYPERYGPANDMYFNLAATASAGVLLLPFEFSYYRLHEGQEINNKFAYLYFNFNYLRDALSGLNLPLSDADKAWIMNKNRRRFLVNLLNYIARTRDLRKAMFAIRQAGFGFTDALRALVHAPRS